MMISANTPRSGKKRVIGLGLAALSLSLFASVSRADNTTAANAKGLFVNSGISDFVAASGDKKFYHSYLYANRSYEISFYQVGKQRGVNAFFAASGSPYRVATDSAFTSPLTVTQNAFGDLEGQIGDIGGVCCGAATVTFTPTASQEHFIELSTISNTGSFYITIRETTLFSPWLSRAAGYQGFNELHNNTNAAVSVTLRAYDSAGTLQGTGLTFSIPANATVFKTGTELGVPAEVAVGVVLTHNGGFGAISGNITTLSGATGLSFDSPFAPRTDFVRMH